jgi:hypothetical protein
MLRQKVHSAARCPLLRSVYEAEYDKYHDIYLQRWWKEDVPWRVQCMQRVTGAEREVGREASGGFALDAASATPRAVWELPPGA